MCCMSSTAHVRSLRCIQLFPGKRLCGLCPVCRVWSTLVRANLNCDCHVSLCSLLQDKVADVTKLKDKCFRSSSSLSVAIAEIAQSTACCEPPHPVTAALFCEAISYLAQKGSAACDKIAPAGGIPVIAQFLECFPDEKQVVFWGCCALYWLADRGSASIKSLILAHPNIISLLPAASARLQAWGRPDNAALALKALGVC
jgi:hypothetical protein